AAVVREAARIHLYPDGGSTALRDALARRLGVRADQFVLGNGADELIALVAAAAFEPGDEVIVPEPSFEPYTIGATLAGARVGLLARHPRLIVLRTFSKIAGLAGLRVGYAVASAETIDRLDRVRAPYNVNRLGQVAALAALDDHEHLERTRRLVIEERAFLSV